ncbi:hypothetical protein CALVIDRAFT_40657 [Calocera viscosa TUFC12733]|uniref:Protein kinase domain-containing protein n=1 Tax=Calocera viscosa (strain TUFC12733) TaxID=1330018 RepID=A0A167P265_CALVF|nr:hypothetical protein CALVIDRAFT_40657 [Calocera viscosa TUFC12733]
MSPELPMASVTVEQTDMSMLKQEPRSPETLKLLTSISARIVEVTRIGDFPIDGGGYADVWRGKRVSDGLEVALKGLRINHEDHSLIKLLVREISIWSTLDHPNVLPFLGLSIQPDLRVPYLVSPWESYGNIIKYLEAHEDADRADLVSTFIPLVRLI